MCPNYNLTVISFILEKNIQNLFYIDGIQKKSDTNAL